MDGTITEEKQEKYLKLEHSLSKWREAHLYLFWKEIQVKSTENV